MANSSLCSLVFDCFGHIRQAVPALDARDLTPRHITLYQRDPCRSMSLGCLSALLPLCLCWLSASIWPSVFQNSVVSSDWSPILTSPTVSLSLQKAATAHRLRGATSPAPPTTTTSTSRFFITSVKRVSCVSSQDSRSLIMREYPRINKLYLIFPHTCAPFSQALGM